MLKSSWLREQMEAEVQSIYTPLARLQALAQERICPEEGIHFLILTKVPSGLEGPPRNLPQMRKDKDGLRPQFSPSACREELVQRWKRGRVWTPPLPSARQSAAFPTSMPNTLLLPRPSGASVSHV